MKRFKYTDTFASKTVEDGCEVILFAKINFKKKIDPLYFIIGINYSIELRNSIKFQLNSEDLIYNIELYEMLLNAQYINKLL